MSAFKFGNACDAIQTEELTRRRRETAPTFGGLLLYD